jgi:dethiobiotin synthetase
LLGASNVDAPYEDVNPWLLTTPASPHLAARHDGVSIAHENDPRAPTRRASSDLLLVEGAGGWLAPISSVATMADIAEKLALPVISSWACGSAVSTMRC